MIFKGQPGKSIEKNLNAIEEVKNKKIYVCFQNKAWATTYIFIKWYKEIYKPYELLVEKKMNVLEFFNSMETEYVFIPVGLTPYLQPLDIGINKPFRTKIKNSYLNFQISLIDKNKSLIMIQSNKAIKTDMIRFVSNE